MQHLIDLCHQCQPAHQEFEVHLEIGPSCQNQKMIQQSGLRITELTPWSTNSRHGASSTSTTELSQQVTITFHKNRLTSKGDLIPIQIWLMFTIDLKSKPASPKQIRKEISTFPTKIGVSLNGQVSLSIMKRIILVMTTPGLKWVWICGLTMIPHNNYPNIQDQSQEL